MNNSRIWLVLNPTVGIPIMFGAMVLASLSIHFTLLSQTTYFAAFLTGGS